MMDSLALAGIGAAVVVFALQARLTIWLFGPGPAYFDDPVTRSRARRLRMFIRGSEICIAIGLCLILWAAISLFFHP